MAKTYEAMLKTERVVGSGWQFLDLKNKKQTGDLEKKIHHFRQKNDVDVKVFNFTCSLGKEGVSTILVNLLNYLTLQKSEKKILVIDANFNDPSLHSIFNLKSQYGLVDILLDSAPLSEAVQSVGLNLDAVCCGIEYKKMTGNISQEKFSFIISEAKKRYDLIIIDSSPLLTSSDALSTAVNSDITFLIIQSFKVRQEVALKAKFLLQNNECEVGGIVLNKIKQVIPAWAYRIF